MLEPLLKWLEAVDANSMFASPQVQIRSFDVMAAPEVADHRALLIDVD